MKMCEKGKPYFLVHKIKTEKRINNWISSTKKKKVQTLYTVLNEGESGVADFTGWGER